MEKSVFLLPSGFGCNRAFHKTARVSRQKVEGMAQSMRQRWIYVDGVAYEPGTEPQDDAFMVIPDFEPFTDNTGTYIGGRRQWREHLRVNGLNELGRDDVMNLKRVPQKPDARARKEGIIAAVREIKSGRNPREVAAVLRERLYRR